METSKCTSIILLIVAIVCIAGITIPLYFFGYKDGLVKNAELRNTVCIVYQNDDVRLSTCSHECNCRYESTFSQCYTYDDNGNSHSYMCTKSKRVCDTCYYTCYQGFYYYYYHVKPEFFNLSSNDLDAIEIGKNYTKIAGGVRRDTEQSARNYYLSNYPIGLSWTCYFNINDHTIILDEMYHPDTFYIASIVFLIISLIICCLAISYGIKYYCEENNMRTTINDFYSNNL